MAAIAMVDEVDVVRLAVGQTVWVTGNAFPDLRMRGTVTHVSAQPLPKARGCDPVRGQSDAGPAGGRSAGGRLRTGMSCTLEIVIYNKAAALMVPIGAVERSGRSSPLGCDRSRDPHGAAPRGEDRPHHPGFGRNHVGAEAG